MMQSNYLFSLKERNSTTVPLFCFFDIERHLHIYPHCISALMVSHSRCRIVVSCNHNRNPTEKVNYLYALTISIVQTLLAKVFVNLLYSHHGWYSYRDMEILVSCRLFLLMRSGASPVSACRSDIREVRAKK